MWRTLAALLVVVALVSGCGSSSGGEKKDYLSGKEHEEAKAIFKTSCVSCHATDLSGQSGRNSNLQKVGSRLTKEEIVEVITNGRRSMPPQKNKFSEEEINLLAEWLAELK